MGSPCTRVEYAAAQANAPSLNEPKQPRPGPQALPSRRSCVTGSHVSLQRPAIEVPPLVGTNRPTYVTQRSSPQLDGVEGSQTRRQTPDRQ